MARTMIGAFLRTLKKVSIHNKIDDSIMAIPA